MRKTFVGLVLLTAALLAAASLVAEEPKWLDPANCYFCKPLTEPEGMLEDLTWENHNITNGSLSITTYPPEWKEEYEAASAKMMELWQNYDPSQEYQLCGMCQAWLTIPFDKVTFETVKFEGGEIGLTTSTDSAVVAQLHEITDKTNAAYTAMMATEGGHEGHDH